MNCNNLGKEWGFIRVCRWRKIWESTSVGALRRMLNIPRMQHVQSWDAVHAKCNILFDGYLRVVTQFPWRLPFNVLNVFCSYDCWWMTLPFCWSWRTESTTHCQGIVQRSASEAECGGGMDVSSFSILSVAIYCKRVDLQWLYDSLWAAAPMGMKLISDPYGWCHSDSETRSHIKLCRAVCGHMTLGQCLLVQRCGLAAAFLIIAHRQASITLRCFTLSISSPL